MFLLLHLLIFYNLILWKPCVSFYDGYNTVRRMRGKLGMLAHELDMDAMMKVKSIQPYKQSFYTKHMEYQYGTLVYEITYRHKQMFTWYRAVLDEIEANGTQPLDRFMDALVEVDSLNHEIVNFVSMIKTYNANRYADKSKEGYDLFFRRSSNMAPIWLGLLDSTDDSDPPEPPPEAPPEEHNLTRTGRRNGVWHYAEVPHRMT